MTVGCKRIGSIAACALACAALLCTSAVAEEKKTGWSSVAEFSLVATSGNSATTTFGFKNTTARAWERSNFTFRAGGIRSESDITRFAVGTSPTSFVVVEESRTTAENYYLNGKYDRKISDRMYWFAGAGWDRNEFAGIKNRYSAAGGVGNVWYDEETTKFRTEYAATFTDQEDVFEDPTVDDTFAGLRFEWAYLQAFSADSRAKYGNDFIVDLNLDETDDWRGNMTNWLAVSMNDRLALKVSLQLLYDNQPSLEQVSLFDPADLVNPTGTVLVELDELDTVFTASLVVNF